MAARFTVVARVKVPEREALTFEQEIVEAAGGTLIDARQMSPQELLAAYGEADAILNQDLEVTAEMIAHCCHRCTAICEYGVGVDNIDHAAASKANIQILNTPGYSPQTIAVHALGLLLACSRFVVSTDRLIRQGEYPDLTQNLPIGVEGKTLGSFGLGEIARNLFRLTTGFRFARRIAVDPYVEPALAKAAGVELVDFETLLEESDFLSIHAPHIPGETTKVFDADAFVKMKRTAILVNAARADLVDTVALVAALQDAEIAGAGLDVYDEEPLPGDHPLCSLDNVALTNHSGWHAEDSYQSIRQMASNAAVGACLGKLPRSITNMAVLQNLGRLDEFLGQEMITQMSWQIERSRQLNLPDSE